MRLLIEGGRTDFFEQSKTRFKQAVNLILEGAVFFDGRANPASPLAKISEMILPTGYFAVLDGPSTMALRLVRYQYDPEGFNSVHLEAEMNTSVIADEPHLVEILKFYEQSSKRPVSDWVHGLDVWNGLIERARNLWGNRWCLFQIACVASAVDIDAATLVGCENLLDTAKPLCSRAAYAKSQNASYQWWRDQLEATVDDTDIVLVVLLMYSWAEGRVVSDMFDLLEEKLSSLSVNNWNKLYWLLLGTMWISDRRAEKRVITISRDTLPASMSPRLAASMLSMSSRVPRQTIFTRYLSDYDGEDEAILTILPRLAVNCARSSNASWRKALEISKSTYKRNIAPDFPIFPERSREMPLELARRVCEKPEQYPLSVLSLAEAAVVTHVCKNIRPVAAIAQEERWFV